MDTGEEGDWRAAGNTKPTLPVYPHTLSTEWGEGVAPPQGPPPDPIGHHPGKGSRLARRGPEGGGGALTFFSFVDNVSGLLLGSHQAIYSLRSHSILLVSSNLQGRERERKGTRGGAMEVPSVKIDKHLFVSYKTTAALQCSDLVSSTRFQ